MRETIAAQQEARAAQRKAEAEAVFRTEGARVQTKAVAVGQPFKNPTKPPRASRPTARVNITERDRALLRILARYRYSQRDMLAFYLASPAIYQRLTKLRNAGFVRRDDLVGAKPLWIATERGYNEIGSDLAAVESRFSADKIAHTLGIQDIGMHLELGLADVLQEGARAPRDAAGKLLGQRVITEREITVAFNRERAIIADDSKRRNFAGEALTVFNARKAELDQNPNAVTKGGREHYFIGWDYKHTHTPDLVLPRTVDPVTGRARSVAIELELHHKTPETWERVLRTYKEDEAIFGEVVYLTTQASIARTLEAIARKVGLTSLRIVQWESPDYQGKRDNGTEGTK